MFDAAILTTRRKHPVPEGQLQPLAVRKPNPHARLGGLPDRRYGKGGDHPSAVQGAHLERLPGLEQLTAGRTGAVGKVDIAGNRCAFADLVAGHKQALPNTSKAAGGVKLGLLRIGLVTGESVLADQPLAGLQQLEQLKLVRLGQLRQIDAAQELERFTHSASPFFGIVLSTKAASWLSISFSLRVMRPLRSIRCDSPYVSGRNLPRSQRRFSTRNLLRWTCS